MCQTIEIEIIINLVYVYKTKECDYQNFAFYVKRTSKFDTHLMVMFTSIFDTRIESRQQVAEFLFQYT